MHSDLSLQVALGRVPCLPTSLYRSPMALQTTPCKEDEKIYRLQLQDFSMITLR